MVKYTIKLPHYKLLTSFAFSSCSMRATNIFLESQFRYNMNCRSKLSLVWQLYKLSEYKISLKEDVSGSVVQMSSVIFLLIGFNSAV